MGNYKKKILAAGFAACFAAVLGLWYWQSRNEGQSPLKIVLIQKAVHDTDIWTSIYEWGQMAANQKGTDHYGSKKRE